MRQLHVRSDPRLRALLQAEPDDPSVPADDRSALIDLLLIMTLWLPSINYNKSYREVSNGMAHALAAERARTGRQECVRSSGLGLSQRASFAVFDNLRFELSGDCPLVLLQGNASVLRNALQRGEYAGSRVLWEGTRAAEFRRAPQLLEYFILLRPVPAGRPAP